MWDSEILFYLVNIALVIFILLCFLGLLVILMILLTISSLKSKGEALMQKADQTLDSVQDAIYETPVFGGGFFSSLLGFLFKSKKAKNTKSDFFARFFDK